MPALRLRILSEVTLWERELHLVIGYTRPLCTTREERDNTMGSKDFRKSSHKRAIAQSGLQSKDSAALLFLEAPNRGRSRLYKHKK